MESDRARRRLESEGAETERCGERRGAVLGMDMDGDTAVGLLLRVVTQVTERLTRVGGGGVGGTAIQVGASRVGLRRGEVGARDGETEEVEEEEATWEKLSKV